MKVERGVPTCLIFTQSLYILSFIIHPFTTSRELFEPPLATCLAPLGPDTALLALLGARLVSKSAA